MTTVWGLRVSSLLRPRNPGISRPPLARGLRAAALLARPCEVNREGAGKLPRSPSYSGSFEGPRAPLPFSSELPPSMLLRPACYSPVGLGWPSSLPFPCVLSLFSAPSASPHVSLASPYNRQSVRFKMVKSSAYHRRSRASPTGQSQKAHVGPRRLSAEYVTPGVVLVKQRRYIAWGFESKRRNRHRKMYPGENVGVAKDSSLVSLVHGRVKYTHDTERDVMLCNVLPEPREELLREDLWRYRTEHVATMEENRHVCHLRMKATRSFPKELLNPPLKPLPRPKYLSRFDLWQNPTLPDAPPLCDDR